MFDLGANILGQALTVIHVRTGANLVQKLSHIFEKGHQTDLARIFVGFFCWVSANILLFYGVLGLAHCK